MASRRKRAGCVLAFTILVTVLASLIGWRLSVQLLSSVRQELFAYREKRWKEAVQAAIDTHFRCQAKELASRVRVVSVKQEFPRQGAPKFPPEAKKLLGLNRYATLEDVATKISESLIHLFFEVPEFLKECSIIENYSLDSSGKLFDVYTFYKYHANRPSKGMLISIGIDSKNHIGIVSTKKVGSFEGLAGNAELVMIFTKFKSRNGCLVPVNGDLEIMLPESNVKSTAIYRASVRFDY